MNISSYKEQIADLKMIADKILEELEDKFNQSEKSFRDENAKVIREKNKEINDLRDSKDKEIDKIKDTKNSEIDALRKAVLKAIQ